MSPIEDAGTDAELLAGSGADGDVFSTLYERHATAILAFHFRRTGCPHTAADLTAETFAEAFASRRRFHDIGAPGRAWLFTIAARQLSRFARRERVSDRYRRRLQLDRLVLTNEDIERIEDLCDLSSMRESVRDALASHQRTSLTPSGCASRSTSPTQKSPGDWAAARARPASACLAG